MDKIEIIFAALSIVSLVLACAISLKSSYRAHSNQSFRIVFKDGTEVEINNGNDDLVEVEKIIDAISVSHQSKM
jgi:hypothetical protein